MPSGIHITTLFVRCSRRLLIWEAEIVQLDDSEIDFYIIYTSVDDCVSLILNTKCN